LLVFGLTACQTSVKTTDNPVQKPDMTAQQTESLKTEKTRLATENNRLLAQETNLKELNRSLNNEVQAKTAMVEELKNKTIKVTLLNSILFSSGQYQLNQQGRDSIAKLVPVMQQHIQQGGFIRIIGHTDNLSVHKNAAAFQDNWDLSSLRAASVVRLLIWGFHLPPKAFRVEGHADTEPKASNATAKGRAENRRIEILLTSK